MNPPLFLPIVLSMALCMATYGIELKVVRPKPSEFLSISSGSTFVIGTVNPPHSKVTCNGVPCEVSADGAFIGYSPIKLLKEGNWMLQEEKNCDVVFEFRSEANAEVHELNIHAISPLSPSAFSRAQSVYDSPHWIQTRKDRLFGLENSRLGEIVFVPRGAILQAFSGNVSNVVCKTESGTELTFSTPETKEIKSNSEKGPRPLELKFPNQNTLLRVSSEELAPSEFNEPMWGVRIRLKGGTAIVEPRTHLREDQRPIDSAKPLKDLRICLDPGHHPDPGAIGPRGFEERQSTLLLAQILSELLKKQGAKVMISREEDPLPLQERHDRFRDLHPDLLISLHNNSVGDGKDPRAKHGTETYYLYPWSKNLAQNIHQSIVKELGTSNTGCFKRNLLVTRFPDCPAILIEPEYLILPDQEKKFMTNEYQTKLAWAIIKGLESFLLAPMDPAVPAPIPAKSNTF